LICGNGATRPLRLPEVPTAVGTTRGVSVRSIESCGGSRVGRTARHTRYARWCTLYGQAGDAVLVLKLSAGQVGWWHASPTVSFCGQGTHREVVGVWRPWPGAVRRPLGALREAVGEGLPGRHQHRRRPLWRDERRFAPVSDRRIMSYRSRFQFPPSALRANAAAVGLTIFRRARVTGWSVTLIRTS